MELDIVMPSKGLPHVIESIKGLRNIPFSYRFFFITEGDSWPKAVNIGFKMSTNDVLLMDDDTLILPETFLELHKYYEYADIIGFRLYTPNGMLQSGGIEDIPATCTSRCPVWPHTTHSSGPLAFNKPIWVKYISTSLVIIKRNVIDRQIMDENWPGTLFEDNEFMFRAVDNGFKILYIPSPAIHANSITKRLDPEFGRKQHLNYVRLREKYPNMVQYGEMQDFEFPEEKKDEEGKTTSGVQQV